MKGNKYTLYSGNTLFKLNKQQRFVAAHYQGPAPQRRFKLTPLYTSSHVQTILAFALLGLIGGTLALDTVRVINSRNNTRSRSTRGDDVSSTHCEQYQSYVGNYMEQYGSGMKLAGVTYSFIRTTNNPYYSLGCVTTKNIGGKGYYYQGEQYDIATPTQAGSNPAENCSGLTIEGFVFAVGEYGPAVCAIINKDSTVGFTLNHVRYNGVAEENIAPLEIYANGKVNNCFFNQVPVYMYVAPGEKMIYATYTVVQQAKNQASSFIGIDLQASVISGGTIGFTGSSIYNCNISNGIVGLTGSNNSYQLVNVTFNDVQFSSNTYLGSGSTQLAFYNVTFPQGVQGSIEGARFNNVAFNVYINSSSRACSAASSTNNLSLTGEIAFLQGVLIPKGTACQIIYCDEVENFLPDLGINLSQAEITCPVSPSVTPSVSLSKTPSPSQSVLPSLTPTQSKSPPKHHSQEIGLIVLLVAGGGLTSLAALLTCLYCYHKCSHLQIKDAAHELLTPPNHSSLDIQYSSEDEKRSNSPASAIIRYGTITAPSSSSSTTKIQPYSTKPVVYT